MDWFTNIFWDGTALDVVTILLLVIILWVVYVYRYNKE